MANKLTNLFRRGDPEKEQPDTPDADWQAMSEFWGKVSDVVEGRDAIIRAGERYLPKFPNETRKDYDLRLKTAKYTNVYRDIVEGLAQKPFAHELTLANEDAPERLFELLEDIDGRGNHLHVFAAETFFSGINNALDWILVDYTRADGLRTVEDERQAGVRPYWVHIPADRVIWVESEVIQGREQLIKAKILEEKGRVKTFVREGDNVSWFVEEEGKDDIWTIVDEGRITIGVIPMVPFITGRRKGAKWQFYPPMKDAVDLQIELYQQETALKHIKTLTCFPMLAGNGVQPETNADGTPQPVPVGPQAVLYAPPNADGNHGAWEWIVTNADTLRFLAEDVKQTAKELREIGRQPLTAQSGNLTVITTAFAAAKGNSAVQAWAMELKDALENALKLTAMWLGIDFEPEVRVFTDFGIDDQDENPLERLLKMRELGDISQITLWEEFKRRGVLSPEFTAEREVEERLFLEIPGGDE